MAGSAFYFKIHRSQMLPALAAVNEAVSGKLDIPILKNVLLQPQGDRLLLRGTDLDIEIQTQCDLLETGSDEGLTIVADDLRRIVSSMPESAEITFAPGKAHGQVLVSGGRSRYNLHLLPPSDFPSMGDKEPPYAFSISAFVLSEAFGKTLFAVNTTMKDRFYLMGCFVHGTDDGKLAVVGTNGLKLAAVRVTPTEAVKFHPAIIPTKTVKSFLKLMSDSKALCVFHISDAKLICECGDLRVTSKLVDGTFPDYQRLIPTRQAEYITANRETTNKAIARACIIAGDTSREAIKISISTGTMQVELATTDGQNSVEVVDIDFDGESYVRGFNGHFLTEMLSSISTSSFRMFGTNATDPGHFTPDNDADEDYIVMPMRVS